MSSDRNLTFADHNGTEIDTQTLGRNFRAFVLEDPTPDPSYLEQEGFEARLQQYRDGDFAFAGVVLERLCICCGRWEDVGSLWGIEHDGTHASVGYLEEVAIELHGEV